jgi:predicted transglutaminase-like cysteine proteinase
VPAVILDLPHWAQLEQVQRAVNEQVRYATDAETYGVAEFWEAANKRGDCEDFALAKRRRLMDLGWPPESLRMALAVDERGVLHAVLTVDVSSMDGRPGTYVLDNRYVHVEPWQRLTGYRWLERQSATAYAWAYVGNPMILRMAGVEMASLAGRTTATSAEEASGGQ